MWKFSYPDGMGLNDEISCMHSTMRIRFIDILVVGAETAQD
jgi:hypothetical protein